MAEGYTDEQLAIQLNEFTTRAELIEAFKTFDKNENGLISAAELRFVFMNLFSEKMTEDEVDEMVREVDVDDDGNIHYKELVKVMKK